MSVLTRILDPHASESAKERVRRLNTALRDAPVEEILRAADEEFAGRVAVLSSFGVESAVLLHHIAAVNRATPVLFLETGKHFPETTTHREDLIARLDLAEVRLLRPDADDLAATDPEGDLWSRDTDACCALRKTRPLSFALEGFDAWITGRKRFQSSTRLKLPVVELDEDGRVKFNPLANWTQDDLDAYLDAHDLPRHPLASHGYTSIGCAPCTSPVADGEDVRAGRWRGSDKTECGIHFTADGRMVRGAPPEAG